LSDLAFKSVEDLLKSNDAELGPTKTRILIREIAMNRLFLASRKVVEILAAYQFKKMSLPLLRRLQRPTGLRVEIEDFYEHMFQQRAAEFLKLYEKKIPGEVLANLTRKAWSRDKPTIIRNDISTVEEIISRFLEESLRDSSLKMLYTKLSDIENLAASRDLPIYLCRLALDVPFHYDVRKWVTGLPLQFNPERRLHLLLDAVEGLLRQADSKRRHVLAQWTKRTRRSEPSLDIERELDQVIAKEGGVEFYDVFSLDRPRNIHFNCEIKAASTLAFRENAGIRGRNDVGVFFRRGMERGSRGKTPAAALGFLQQWGFLPVVAYTSNRRFRIRFSPRFDCRYWKIGWCLNYLKDQIVSSPDPDLVNPANLGYFSLPESLRKEMGRATRLAKKVAGASIPRALLRAFENTSDEVARVIPMG
jgi:hypothetical protein